MENSILELSTIDRYVLPQMESIYLRLKGEEKGLHRISEIFCAWT